MASSEVDIATDEYRLKDVVGQGVEVREIVWSIWKVRLAAPSSR